MMDEKTASESKLLLGHGGPVYATSFSPDRNFLLTCSEDATSKKKVVWSTLRVCLFIKRSGFFFLNFVAVRLWSLQTWTNLCCYKGHMFPVWNVAFRYIFNIVLCFRFDDILTK